MKSKVKNKKRTYTILIVVLGLVLILGYFMWFMRWKNFTDNGQAGSLQVKFGDGDYLNGGGAVAFKSIKAHKLKVGDKVEIKQNEGFVYPEYNGKAVVSYIISDTIFAIDKGFKGNTVLNPGKYRRLF